ncbi:MAG: 4Fe-4S binding protein [Chloroflexi bacterium]|nr:MAG: 4Fe-4S binding protein [Chloroflexota bacterium]
MDFARVQFLQLFKGHFDENQRTLFSHNHYCHIRFVLAHWHFAGLQAIAWQPRQRWKNDIYHHNSLRRSFMKAKTKIKIKKKRSLMKTRYWIQGFAVFGTFLIGLRHMMPGEASTAGAFDAFCPFGAIESLLPYLFNGQTLKTTNLLNFSIMLGVLGVSLVAGRAFCGWLCPLGAVQDFLAWLARRLSGEKQHVRGKKSKVRFPMQLPKKADAWARNLKYVVLGLVVWVSVTAVYPPLHFLCPVRAVFSFNLKTGLMWSVLITFIVTSMLIERFWCKYLCPMGALLAVFNKIMPLHLNVNTQSCVDCGRCDTECPMDIEDAHANSRDLECIQCLECLETCAIKETITLELL